MFFIQSRFFGRALAVVAMKICATLADANASVQEFCVLSADLINSHCGYVFVGCYSMQVYVNVISGVLRDPLLPGIAYII